MKNIMRNCANTKNTVTEDNWKSVKSYLKGVLCSYYEIRQAMVSSSFKEVSGYIKTAVTNFQVKKFILSFIPFTCYLLLFRFYKELRAVTTLDQHSRPHIGQLGNIEEHIFFCQPHQILSKLANPVFDVLAAIPYLLHFPLPFFFGIFLLIHPKRQGAVYPFLWCAGWVNFIAAIVQFTLPTAPPWYADSAVYDKHGHVVYLSPCEAGFSRLDRLMGMSVFHGLYSKSPVTFGAFPSLHVAIPMVVFLNHPWGGWKVGLTHVIWIALAAMYSTHHYFIDVLGGLVLAVIVRYFMLRWWSPFDELSTQTSAQDTTTNHINRLLKLTYRLPSSANLLKFNV